MPKFQIPKLKVNAKTREELAKANSEDGIDETLATLRGISNRLSVPDDTKLAASA